MRSTIPCCLSCKLAARMELPIVFNVAKFVRMPGRLILASGNSMPLADTKPSTSRRRLLLTDGHSSHLTAKFIAFCLKNTIDLVVLPPHSLHILQPLDVAVFSPLKTYLSRETDRLSRLDPGRISKIE